MKRNSSLVENMFRLVEAMLGTVSCLQFYLQAILSPETLFTTPPTATGSLPWWQSLSPVQRQRV